MTGIRADIFKGPHGSFDGKGQFSSVLNEVTVVVGPDRNMDSVSESNQNAPPVCIVRRTVFGRPYLTAYPCDNHGNKLANRTFGGCYIHSSDSRITSISEYPIPLHDRVE